MQTDEKINSKQPSINEAESLESRSQAFADAYERVTSHPAVFAVLERKHSEAMLAWAFCKMGLKRWQYFVEGARDFAVLCALRVLATNRNIEDVANEIPYELPLKLTKKRTGFIELIPRLHEIAAEYEKVCELAKSAKVNVRAAAQFKINLRNKLERFAEEEKLKPAPKRDKLDALIKNYDLRTQPSQIAAAYVGRRHATSSANVKKLVALIRVPTRMQKALGKDLKARYLPADFEEIKQSLTN